jgi:hypothetical protein
VYTSLLCERFLFWGSVGRVGITQTQKKSPRNFLPAAHTHQPAPGHHEPHLPYLPYLPGLPYLARPALPSPTSPSQLGLRPRLFDFHPSKRLDNIDWL